MTATSTTPNTAASSSDTDRSTRLQAALDRQVLHGLAAEWDNALWLLPPVLRDRMRRPLFRIHEGDRRWGSWDAARREISLSRHLIGRHRWDDVKEILLHEMAHQVAQEGFAAVDEPAHGERFREACRLLRANPAASGRYPPLSERLRRGEALDDSDRMTIRIHKLMALAGSSNPNEAHAAMAKAHELIARHNIVLITRRVRQDYISVFLGQPRLRHFREAYHLAHLLQDFYFVQGVWVAAWALDKGKMGRVLEISGSLKNVRIGEYVFHAVRRYIDAAWRDYRSGKRLDRYRKTDFAVGIIAGFRSTLEASARAAVPQAAGDLPVAREDPALSRYVDERYGHLQRFSRRGPGHDPQVLADGTETGRKLIIAKGIARDDGFRQRQLDYRRATGRS